MTTLLKDYQQVRSVLAQSPKGIQLPEMHIGGYSYEAKRFTSHQKLWETVVQQGPIMGWYLWTSGKNLQTNAREIPEPQGYLLAAELLLSEHCSLQVRHLGSAGWQLTRLCDDPHAENQLWDDVVHLRDGGGRLRYRRFFQVESGDAPTQNSETRPIAARFLGFDNQ